MLPLVVSVRNDHVLAVFLCEIFMWMLHTHYYLILEENRRRLAEKLLRHYAFKSVIMINDKITFVIVVCLLHLPYLLLQALHRI